MSRYYGYVVIHFMDGSTARIGGNRDRTDIGLLSVWTEDSVGFRRELHTFPVHNIKYWRWED